MKLQDFTIGAGLPAVAIFLSAFGAGDVAAGTVTLTNDDTVSGTVTSQSDDGVTVDHPDLGTLNIPAANVAGVTLEESDPIYVAPPEPEFFVGWDKTLAAGLTGSNGNTDSLNLYASFNTGYENKTDRWAIDADVFYSENEGVNTTNYYQASVTKDWLAPEEPHFFWVQAKYENDRFTGWQERVSGYVGVGYDLIDKENYNLLARLGVGGSYEAGDIEDFSTELLLGLEGSWDINDDSSLSYYTYFYPFLDPFFEEFRNTTGVAYQVAIDKGKGMSLKVGAENQYNSNASAGTKENDLKYYLALVFDF